MNVGEVLEIVEQSLLSRQLSSLERFILCQSWLRRSYSEMARDCAYSIAHIKEIGSQLWQALSKALGERVTKKNLFLVLKQYLLSRTGETVASDQLSVTCSLVEVIDPPLTPTTNQPPVTTDLVEASYSGDSDQLARLSDRCVVTQESSQLKTAQQQYQTSTEVENHLQAPAIDSEPTIPSACLPLDSPLYINPPPIEQLTYTAISQPGCLLRIKAPRLRGKSSLPPLIPTRATARAYNTVYLDFQELVLVQQQFSDFPLTYLADLS